MGRPESRDIKSTKPPNGPPSRWSSRKAKNEFDRDSKREAKREARAVRPFVSSLMTGRVNVSPRGFAFVTTSEGAACYIRADLARRLLTGDVIRFWATYPSADGSQDVIEVRHVQRREQVILCGVAQLADLNYLIPDDPCYTPVQLAQTANVRDFSVGDVLGVRLPAYEGTPRDMTTPGGPLVGVLVGNLGQRTRNGFDLDYARMRHGFEQDLPPELNTLVAEFDDPSTLVPSTTVPFVTIDGDSTRDFDDAVYAERGPEGTWLVQVAISDVSHYVAEGTSLDKWAASQGTSVYLPGLTLPMLPEGLSTDRCSLIPDQTRRAVVMHLRLSAEGVLLASRIERALIKSAARLTYSEVAEFLSHDAEPGEELGAVPGNLRALYEVYKLLSARRKEQGRLDFEDPEPTAKFRDGKLVVEWEVRNDAHKLIEELMLLANQEAAGMLLRRYGLGLVRHQPKPTPDAWMSLRHWAGEQSHVLPEAPCLKAMADLVAAMPDAELRAESIMKVRMSMQPARYQAMTGEQLFQHGGHFSLSAPWYTHFTSPIRRYADLLVHRLLLAPDHYVLNEADSQALCAAVEQCADRSQASRFAERLVWDRLKLKGFLEEHGPEVVHAARVARISPRGFRVVLPGWQVAGWLSGAMLRQAGITRNQKDVWVSGEGAAAKTVREGSLLQVTWTDVNLDRPAHPELQVKVVEKMVAA